jgi:hypothetical protein
MVYTPFTIKPDEWGPATGTADGIKNEELGMRNEEWWCGAQII